MELGGKHSEETKDKIRFSCLIRDFPVVDKTKVIIAIHKRCDKPCIDITNNIEYRSISEAAREINVHPNQVSRVCRGIRESVHGIIFRFL